MKKNLLLLFTVCLLLQTSLMANTTVIVKGYIRDSANNAISGRTVTIINNDSTNQGCLLSHKVVTNPNGYYIDTLTCDGTINKLMVIVENCDGNKIVKQPVPGISNIVEVNFVICKPGTAPVPASCKAVFNFTPTNEGIKFSSTASAAVAEDSIIARTWVFGDSSAPLTGNRVDPAHIYTKAGSYNVCLSIKTKKGCESNYCTTVVVKLSDSASQTGCKAYFTITAKDSAIYFNSKGASVPVGDSIISRSWIFGDNSAAATTIDPVHVYTKPGSYIVYLTIKTKKGCESKYIDTVKIPAPASACRLEIQVSFEKISARKFRFSSSQSKAVGDSIISRKWNFGDGSLMDGNEISPLKEFQKSGVFNVCVTMKTKNGCEKAFCVQVTVSDSTTATACKAYFTATAKDSAIYFNSKGSTVPDGDSIISRTWIFGDNSASATTVDPVHVYTKPGSYIVYLSIKTKKGCESKYTDTVNIPAPPSACRLEIQVNFEKITAHKFRFNSSQSKAVDDSIISRKWNFGDGSLMDGNEISPLKEFQKTGVFNVCVTMKTKNGCEKAYCVQVTVSDSTQPAACKALFTFLVQNTTVKFNSAPSTGTAADDSIISRTWVFGDSSATATTVDPTHVYAKPGSYTVYLYIKTKKGCESKNTAVVVVMPALSNCPVDVQFVASRISPKKIQFNSLQSNAQQGDSIIQRRWKFGDGTALEGNNPSPVKEFPMIGIYNTCLEVKTAKGCAAQVCKQVIVQDSVNMPGATVDYIKIITLTPNPVVTRMLATIWSRNSDVEVEITIYDIYGSGKLTIKKLLSQGNNIIEIPAANLYHGPYFLKVSSRNGKDSKAFYKL